jgi:flagellar protein FliO/FliZ
MQMLQQYLGEQGARYAAFVLIAIVLLAAVLIIWVLIRKALGSRLNFSEKPDRRGRAPRLGITESFNVDREGRRLVIVRRDNFEHLVMIGGPNDVVIETTILRGERLTVGRNDQRAAEPELIPTAPRQISETLQPVLSAPLPTPSLQATPVQKVSVQPAPIPAQARITPRQPKPDAPVFAPASAPAPAPSIASPSVPPPLAPSLKVGTEVRISESKPMAVAQPTEPPKAPIVAAPPAPPVAPIPTPPHQSEKISTSESVAATAKAAVARMMASKPKPEELKAPAAEPLTPPTVASETQPAAVQVAAKPTLSERMKLGAFFGKKDVGSVPPPPPVDVSKIIEDAPRVKLPEAAKPAPSLPPVPTPATSKPSESMFAAEMRQLEEATRVVKSPPRTIPDNVLPPVAASRMSEASKVLQTSPPSQISAQVGSAPPAGPTPPPVVSPSPMRPVSKNPFDSLEEEMAKLLGRTPEGKG